MHIIIQEIQCIDTAQELIYKIIQQVNTINVTKSYEQTHT